MAAFSDLTPEQKLELAVQQINYWRTVEVALKRYRVAITKEEQAAIVLAVDNDLQNKGSEPTPDSIIAGWPK